MGPSSTLSLLTTILLALTFLAASAVAQTTQPASTSQHAISTPSEGPCDIALAKAASASTGERAAAALDAASCLLVVDIAPALNAIILDDAADRGGALQSLASARTQLDAADESLEQVEDAARRHDLAERIALIRAFEGVFSAVVSLNGGDPDHDAVAKACIALAPYLDSEQPGVAASARFWQGVAYRRSGRPDRALLVLRPVLADPTFPAVELMARLERCRALADVGQHAAALALCLRLGAKIEEWFAGDAPSVRGEVNKAVRWTRVLVLRAWARSLRDAGEDPETAAAFEQDADKLWGDRSTPRMVVLTEMIAGFSHLPPPKPDVKEKTP